MSTIECQLRLILKSTTLQVTNIREVCDPLKSATFRKRFHGIKKIKTFMRFQDINMFLTSNSIEVPIFSVPINVNELKHKVYYAEVAIGNSLLVSKEYAINNQLPINYDSFIVMNDGNFSGEKNNKTIRRSNSANIESPLSAATVSSFSRRKSDQSMSANKFPSKDGASGRNSDFSDRENDIKEKSFRESVRISKEIQKKGKGSNKDREDRSRNDLRSSRDEKYGRNEYDTKDQSDYDDRDYDNRNQNDYKKSGYDRDATFREHQISQGGTKIYIKDGEDIREEHTGKAVYKLLTGSEQSQYGSAVAEAIYYPRSSQKANSTGAKLGGGSGSRSGSRLGGGSGGGSGFGSMMGAGQGNHPKIPIDEIDPTQLIPDEAIDFDDLFYLVKDPSRVNVLYEVHFDYDRGLENGKGECERCKEYPSVLYCLAERASLCKVCDQNIHFDEYTRRHQIYYYESKDNKKKFLLCPFHPENVSDFFCEECMSILCSYCKISGTHSAEPYSTHKLMKFVDACDMMAEKIKTQEEDLENIFEEVKMQITDTVSREDKNYTTMVNQIRNKIEMEYKCAISDLDAIVKKKYQVLNAIYIEKRVALEKCVRIQHYIDEVDSGQIVKDYKAIKEQKELMLEKIQVPPSGSDKIIFKGYLSIFREEDGENRRQKKE